ncbi:MAG: hypothetical protein LBI86_11175, partial [Treponema sp.]|nr:hypothetical protein [Treponema sp.]
MTGAGPCRCRPVTALRLLFLGTAAHGTAKAVPHTPVSSARGGRRARGLPFSHSLRLLFLGPKYMGEFVEKFEGFG